MWIIYKTWEYIFINGVTCHGIDFKGVYLFTAISARGVLISAIIASRGILAFRRERYATFSRCVCGRILASIDLLVRKANKQDLANLEGLKEMKKVGQMKILVQQHPA